MARHGVTQGAGRSLRWLRDTIGAADGGPDAAGDPYDRLYGEAAEAPRQIQADA